MDCKPIIYQLLPRLFTNTNPACIPNGTLEQNGVGKMNHITPKVLNAIKELGVTHIWYTGVIEHATKTDYTSKGIFPADNPHVVKGQAGSPYAIKDYYDVDPDLAEDVANRMQEFENLITRTHDAGLEVIIDFVPNHTARRYHSDVAPAGVDDFGAKDDTDMFFSPCNNYYYITRQLFAPSIDLGKGKNAYIEFPAKATGDDCFTAFPGPNNWYETVKLNYGRDPYNGQGHFDPIPDTWFKMLNILRFWASKGVDAFRCDMAHMVPIEFWQWAIPNVKDRYPHVKFIAEIYDVGLYRDFIHIGGFDYLYDKVNLYDTLRGVQCSNFSAATITNCWQAVEGIQPNMLNFLENHDEQRFGSKFYAGDPAKVIPSLVVSSMISTGPMMIYFGQELGEQATDSEGFSGFDGRTTIFDYWSVATLRRWYNNGDPDGSQLTPRERWLRAKYATILKLCNSEKAISRGRFYDLMYVNYHNPSLNPHRQYAFLRNCDGVTLLIAVNFSADSCDLAINVPLHAFEMLNIPQGQVNARELLTQQVEPKVLTATEPFRTMIPPYEAVVWKIRNRDIKPLPDPVPTPSCSCPK